MLFRSCPIGTYVRGVFVVVNVVAFQGTFYGTYYEVISGIHLSKYNLGGGTGL